MRRTSSTLTLVTSVSDVRRTEYPQDALWLSMCEESAGQFLEAMTAARMLELPATPTTPRRANMPLESYPLFVHYAPFDAYGYVRRSPDQQQRPKRRA